MGKKAEIAVFGDSHAGNVFGMPFHPRECFDLRPFRLKLFQPRSCKMTSGQYNEESDEYRRILLSLADKFPSLKYWDTAAALCDKLFCHAPSKDLVLYRDPGHLTIGGSKYLGDRLYLKPASDISTLSRE